MTKDFSAIGRALAAPARSTIVAMLMDGTSRPAGELAAAAGVGASTASEHLTILVESGLVAAEAQGRHRFFHLANPEVASALEQLGHLCPEVPINSYRQSKAAAELAEARLCYDHLAGRLGLRVSEALIERKWISEGFTDVTEKGRECFQRLEIDVNGLQGNRRPLVRSCRDWTERKPHLAGALGAAVAELFLVKGWVARRRSSRALEVTAAGRDSLGETWALTP